MDLIKDSRTHDRRQDLETAKSISQFFTMRRTFGASFAKTWADRSKFAEHTWELVGQIAVERRSRRRRGVYYPV